MQIKKQQLEQRYGTMEWFKIEREVRQDCVLSPCLFNLYVEYIMQNAKMQAG